MRTIKKGTSGKGRVYRLARNFPNYYLQIQQGKSYRTIESWYSCSEEYAAAQFEKYIKKL